MKRRESTALRVASFTAIGRPVTQGSLVAFKHKTTGRIVTPQKRDLTAWRKNIAAVAAAQNLYLAKPLLVEVDLSFWLELGQRADLDKLVRAVLDALTGVVFEDDVQVVSILARKHLVDVVIGRPPRVQIHVQEMCARGLGGATQ